MSAATIDVATSRDAPAARVETRTASMRWVYASLAAYVTGLALFPPRVVLVADETRYVEQALAFNRGLLRIPRSGILYPAEAHRTISDYPPGTSLLQTPFVWLLGWRGAMLVSVLSLIAATLVTARWLAREGRDPAFALFIPGYIGAAFFGRIGMSDMPTTALVATTCMLLWGADGSRGRSWAAGFCAGAVLLFREPPVLIVLPLLLGAVLRRRAAFVPATLGFAAAVLARLALSAWLFGTPWYVRPSGIGFAPGAIAVTLPVYAALLLVFIPGAALAVILYRGDRRPELVAAFTLTVLLFLLYDYDAILLSGPIKGPMQVSRYLAPLLPLVAYMAAEVWPRLATRFASHGSRVRGALRTSASLAAVAVAFLIHPIAHRQEAAPLAVVKALYSYTRADRPIVTNVDATLKYFSVAYGPRQLVLADRTPLDSLVSFARRYGGLTIAFLDRSDSEMFRADAARNARLLMDIGTRCALRPTYRESFGWAELRTMELDDCR
ncbi:MAG TPA: hypothetical protein VKH19_07300 [Gemmatimonadaceae bacterium]|nr:hypothetical protein [Gemmatimonadaceae bacterium]